MRHPSVDPHDHIFSFGHQTHLHGPAAMFVPRCRSCGKEFKTNRALTQHLRQSPCGKKRPRTAHACADPSMAALCLNIYLNGVYEIFRFNHSYLGTPWFDSCLMEVWDNKREKSETRVGKIKGLVHIHESVTVVPRCMHVLVQLSTEPLSIKDMQQEFICPYTLEEFLTVLPLHCVQSLLASCQYSSENERQNFCVLPHRKWAQYFSDKIMIEDREVN